MKLSLSIITLLLHVFYLTSVPVNAEQMTAESFLSSLTFKEGKIVLGDDLATINLTDSYRYLSPEDTTRVLVEAWGNPPADETMGMIVPAGVNILDENSWAVVISYEEDGYVSDKEADSIDYTKLLGEIQETVNENIKDRTDAGYEAIELVGWAAPPFYEAQAHKLHWAKELKFGDTDINTLNYNIRILGRKGVLVLNIVAGMPMLAEINNQIPSLLAMTEFNPGNRYTDFDPKIDKIAAYGIAALVAGKVASKVGLFAKLGAILFGLKKLWIGIVIALGAFFKKIFNRE